MFNITIRATDKKDLLKQVAEQAADEPGLPEKVKGLIEDLVAELPAPKSGYLQLTGYGHFEKDSDSSIVLNLSSHTPD